MKSSIICPRIHETPSHFKRKCSPFTHAETFFVFYASDDHVPSLPVNWNHQGPVSAYDATAVRRGFQVGFDEIAKFVNHGPLTVSNLDYLNDNLKLGVQGSVCVMPLAAAHFVPQPF